MCSCRLAVFVDLSGTVHVEDCVIPGAIDAITRLRANRSIGLRFVTNTSKESINHLHKRLQRIGCEISKSEMFTSLTAARAYVERRKLRPVLFLEDVAMEDFEGVSTSEPNAVVVGLAPSKFRQRNMNEAAQLLLSDRRTELVAINKSRYFKKDNGLSLGPGAFVEALEFASDKQAVVVGKPEKSFFLAALSSLERESGTTIAPEHCVMIGDDARDDVLGAVNAGMKGILVKTGKYCDGDENKLAGANNGETYVATDVNNAVDIINCNILKYNDKT